MFLWWKKEEKQIGKQIKEKKGGKRKMENVIERKRKGKWRKRGERQDSTQRKKSSAILFKYVRTRIERRLGIDWWILIGYVLKYNCTWLLSLNRLLPLSPFPSFTFPILFSYIFHFPFPPFLSLICFPIWFSSFFPQRNTGWFIHY